MSDSTLAEIVAEGRRLGAAATPGPWKFERETFDGTKYAGGLLALFAEGEDETVCWYRAVVPQRIKTGEEEFVQFGTPADAALVAFARNNFARLLAVAEAAMEMREAQAFYFSRHSIETDADHGATRLANAVAAFDSAAGAREGEGR